MQFSIQLLNLCSLLFLFSTFFVHLCLRRAHEGSDDADNSFFTTQQGKWKEPDRVVMDGTRGVVVSRRVGA